ncbi:hypothetical protein B0T25DRAFT_605233 [Lasiosphaeria hispida]|uniref:Uncharacterized protein n=1 Tax=Lasiosphaeria hispida TaxID=260671 RepID=A0AAJ0HNM6_9PEZI|nr:hypothetical protein B0T25DRAFT_605233 [Lasiosphaeria hispida]
MGANAINLKALDAHLLRLVLYTRSAWNWAEKLLTTEDMFPRAPGRRAIAPLISVPGMGWKVQCWENMYCKLRDDPIFLTEADTFWDVMLAIETEIPAFLNYWNIVKRANNIMCLTAYVSQHSWGGPREGRPACLVCNPPAKEKGVDTGAEPSSETRKWKSCPDFGHDVRETALVSAIVNKGWEWYRVFHMKAEEWDWVGDMGWLLKVYPENEEPLPVAEIDAIIQQDYTQPTPLEQEEFQRHLEQTSFGLDDATISVSVRRLVEVANSPTHRLEDGASPRIRLIFTRLLKGQSKAADSLLDALVKLGEWKEVKIIVEYADSQFLVGPASAKHQKAWQETSRFSTTKFEPKFVERPPTPTCATLLGILQGEEKGASPHGEDPEVSTSRRQEDKRLEIPDVPDVPNVGAPNLGKASQAVQTEMQNDGEVSDVDVPDWEKRSQGTQTEGGSKHLKATSYTASQLIKGRFPEQVLPEKSDAEQSIPEQSVLEGIFPSTASQRVQINGQVLPDPEVFQQAWDEASALPAPPAPESDSSLRIESENALNEVEYEQLGYAPIDAGLKPIIDIPETDELLIEALALEEGEEIKGNYLCVDMWILMALASDVSHGTCRDPKQNNPDAVYHFARWLLPALYWKKLICTRQSAEECIRRIEAYGTKRERFRAYLMFGMTWRKVFREQMTRGEYQRLSAVDIPRAFRLPIRIVKDGDYPKGMPPGELAGIIKIVQKMPEGYGISHEGRMALILGWACGTTTLMGSSILFLGLIDTLETFWRASQLMVPRLKIYIWAEPDGCGYPGVKAFQPIGARSKLDNWYKDFVVKDENAVLSEEEMEKGPGGDGKKGDEVVEESGKGGEGSKQAAEDNLKMMADHAKS